MPIIIFVIYIIIGWSVVKHLIKEGSVETAFAFWFYVFLWLPAFILGCIFIAFKFMLKLPKRIAEKAINKHA